MVQDVGAGASVVMTTNGDMVYYNSGRQRLAKASDGNVLTQASGLPSWAAASSGGLWSQAYQATVSDANFDTGSGGITFKKYIQMWLSWKDFDLNGGTNYKLESIFNNSTTAEYDSRYFQNANAGTRVGQGDLNIYEAGGTMTEASAGNLLVSMVNINGEPKYGLAQGSWYVDGEAGGYFNRSTVWWQWTNTALLTRVAIDPNFDDVNHKFANATLTIMHTDG